MYLKFVFETEERDIELYVDFHAHSRNTENYKQG